MIELIKMLLDAGIPFQQHDRTIATEGLILNDDQDATIVFRFSTKGTLEDIVLVNTGGQVS